MPLTLRPKAITQANYSIKQKKYIADALLKLKNEIRIFDEWKTKLFDTLDFLYLRQILGLTKLTKHYPKSTQLPKRLQSLSVLVEKRSLAQHAF